MLTLQLDAGQDETTAAAQQSEPSIAPNEMSQPKHATNPSISARPFSLPLSVSSPPLPPAPDRPAPRPPEKEGAAFRPLSLAVTSNCKQPLDLPPVPSFPAPPPPSESEASVVCNPSREKEGNTCKQLNVVLSCLHGFHVCVFVCVYVCVERRGRRKKRERCWYHMYDNIR